VAAAGAASALAAPGLPVRTRAALAVAAAGAGAFGGYDDIAGSGAKRGFKGHLGALAHGEITTGSVKLGGIGATGLVAAALTGGPAVDVAINTALVAGSANLLNLFDLRPGRAIKVTLAAGLPIGLTQLAARPGPGRGMAAVAVPLGAAAALLPDDLGERAMLGDAGANSLGAMLGVAAASSLTRRSRLALLAGVTGLTAASEVVSFTKVIQATPPLNRLDQLGRRPVVPEARPSGTP
jgi:UDP-GlcNAc:undecaprenyl-phosphate/decaprenyl-phosphate GlcNAc-1-phosphate transferase